MIATDAASMESFPSVLIGSSALEVAGALLAAAGTAFVTLTVVAVAAYVYQQQYVLSLRARRYESTKTKSRTVPRGDPAFLPPKNWWRIEELEEYDGSGDVDGPILLAVDGLVFNVAKARDFYGPGGEYAVMGGKDASRYLAKNTVEPETQDEAAIALNVAEKAALAAWKFSFEQKYDVLGRLVGPDQEERMRATEERTKAYMDRMEELSASMEEQEQARERLEAMWEREAAPEGDF